MESSRLVMRIGSRGGDYYVLPHIHNGAALATTSSATLGAGYILFPNEFMLFVQTHYMQMASALSKVASVSWRMTLLLFILTLFVQTVKKIRQPVNH